MIEQSLTYLESPAALASLQRDPYWPKWDSPWWHMLLLHEMGLTDRLPRPIVEAMVDALNGMKCHIFPITAAESQGLDPLQDSLCHCAAGTMYGVLACAGVDMDARLPWLRTWLSGYQMADGGATCDNEAYLVTDECPSSMVGLVPCFEALVRYVPEWTDHERSFLERGAGFLLGRELRLGSSSRHNAEERAMAPRWLELTFPRFYFYDLLRGLSVLLEWAERINTPLPGAQVRMAADYLEALAPKGELRVGRQAFAGQFTRHPPEPGRAPASLFPLLEEVSRVGEPSPYLTWQYAAARERLEKFAR